MDNFWLVLVCMASITFCCRYLFFSEIVNFKLGVKLKRLLSFAAPAVLTSMWVPIVFLGHQKSQGDWMTSPFLIAGMVAIFLSLKINNTLLVLALSMGCFGVVSLITHY